MTATKRLNLDLGPKSSEALRKLQESLETASQAETIRLALQTLEKIVEEAEAGGRITIERPDGERVEVVVPGVTRRAAPVIKIADGRRKIGG